MINKVKNTILKEKLINKGDNILIALSGGPDSVFLFHMLRELKDILSFTLYASHINHMYRGIDADHDEKFVKSLCDKYDIKLFIKRKNATEYAKELKLTEEEAGRKLRYDFFKENLNEINGGKIAVAHNLNDQSETVIQRIIRGTGIDGLSAMSFKAGNLIRPILNINKKEILEYLGKNNYEYCMDYTNSLPIYGRNKIRLNLIPYLESEYNPNIQNVLFRMSRLMYDDSKIIDKYISIKYKECLKETLNDKIVLDLETINKLEDFEIRRVIKIAIKNINGNANNIESKHLDEITKLIRSSSTGKQLTIGGGIIINLSYSDINIRKSIEKCSNFEYNMNINELLYIKEVRKSIIIRTCKSSEFVKKNDEFYVDYDKIHGKIIVRNRRNSDKMIPFGMHGTKKLKDIFIDNKVPIETRDKIILLEDDNNIIWLENYRISECYRVDKNTERILIIKTMEDEDGRYN